MAVARAATMRSSFLSAALLFGATALACSAKIEDQPGGGPDTATSPAPLCVARDADLCEDARHATPDEPPREGAILWAQATSGTAGGSADVPKLAIYPDGTLRRTPIIRNLASLLTPPRGLVRARLAPASLARLRADVDAASADPGANAHAFVAPNASKLTGDDANVFVFGAGTACFRRLDDRSASCVPDAIRRLQADVAALLDASEQLWRDARSGTVSLSVPLEAKGRWPLAQEVTDGVLQLTREEWSRVGQTGLYRLDGGEFFYVNFAMDNDGGELLYVSRMSAITLDDAQADVRGDLLANIGRYEASKGAWLGLPLGPDRFPAFKNREIAIVPASGAAPEQLYALKAIETFDLEGEAPIALP